MTPYSNLGQLAARKGKRVKLYRNENLVTVGTTDSKLLGSNPRRWGVIFGTPIGSSVSGYVQPTDGTVSGHALDTTTTGNKLVYTCPANTTALVEGAVWVNLGGTAPSMRLVFTPNGGSSVFFGNPIAGGTVFNTGVAMSAGDTFAWNCSTIGAGSTIDAAISVLQYPPASAGSTDNTVFISTDGPASVNGGMPLHPGNDPFMMTYEHIGQAIREEIRAIAANTPVTLTIWDIFEVDCPCSDGEYDNA